MKYQYLFIIPFILVVVFSFGISASAQYETFICDGTNMNSLCGFSGPYCVSDNSDQYDCINRTVVRTATDPTDVSCTLSLISCDKLYQNGTEWRSFYYCGGTATDPVCGGYNGEYTRTQPINTSCRIKIENPTLMIYRECPGDPEYVPPPPVGSPTNDPRFRFTITPDSDLDGIADNGPFGSRWGDTFTYFINLHNEYGGYVNFNFSNCPSGANCSIGSMYSFEEDPSDDDSVIFFTISAPNTVPPNLYSISVTGSVLNTPISHAQPFEFWLRDNLINNAQCTSITAPDSVTAGSYFGASMTMLNTGTKPWTTVWNSPIDGQHRLAVRQPEGTTDLRWGTYAIDMVPGTIVDPGESYTFSNQFSAPASMPSSYCTDLGGGSFRCPFTWRMIEEGVEWFPNGTSCTKNITITPPVIEPDLRVALKYPADPTITYFTESGPSAEGIKDSPYTLSWGAVANATSCTLDGNPVAVSGGSFDVPAPLTVSPTTHTMTCSGASGSPGSDTITLTIPPPPTNLQASCNPLGTQITATWDLPVGYTHSYFRESTSVNNEENMIGNPQTKSFPTTPGNTYSVWVHTRVSDANPAYSDALVKNNIICPVPPPPPTVTLTGFSPSIGQGEAQLDYIIANADTCLRTSNPSIAAWNNDAGITSGTRTVNGLTGTTRFTLSCTNISGTTSRFVDVTPDSDAMLIVSKNGGGKVIGTGINCGADCSESFIVPLLPALPVSVTLTAEPGSSFWVFDKWSGDVCNGSTNPTCIVSMTEDRDITAFFKPKPFIYREF